MSRKHRKKRSSPARPGLKVVPVIAEISPPGIIQTRKTSALLAILLLGFGVYLSIQFWGQKPMPHPDAPYFFRTGYELLHLQVPTTFKRAPVTGLLQVLLSYLVGGQQPRLTAGWLLNAILHPLNLLLFWLIGRRFIGRAAAWLAIICILNPWVTLRMTETIAETPLLFFSLLSIYLILRRSNWAYLAASLATMVRYEGAALIFAAFVMDMITATNGKARLKALGWATLASLPLALWLLGTWWTWDPKASHYLHHYQGKHYELLKYLAILWHTSIGPLLSYLPGDFARYSPLQHFWGFSRIFTFLMFVFGIVYYLFKKRWEILPLVIFFILWMMVHIGRNSAKDRYYAPMAWLVLLVACCGIKSTWQMIRSHFHVPNFIVTLGQILLVLLCGIGIAALIKPLERFLPLCPNARLLPYLVPLLLLLFTAVYMLFCRSRYLLGNITLTVITVFFILGNQFTLAFYVGRGTQDIEFKYMADWYLQHTRPGEKILCTLPSPIGMVVPPQQARNFLHTRDIAGPDPQTFTKNCLANGITYVTWDSRIGDAVGNSYYRSWGIEKIKFLRKPRSCKIYESATSGSKRLIGYYEFKQQIRNPSYPRRYINIFQLHPPADAPHTK